MPTGVYPRKSLAERVAEKIDRRGPDECWPWTGKRNAHGYGMIHIGKVDGRWRETRATRIAYATAFGEFDSSLNVCHRCDNPICCNPAHLFLGTQQDNIADMQKKGRAWWFTKTHCKRGHEFNEENTYSPRPNFRACRVCKRIKAKENYAAKARSPQSPGGVAIVPQEVAAIVPLLRRSVASGRRAFA
jgi:hypothetical protein